MCVRAPQEENERTKKKKTIKQISNSPAASNTFKSYDNTLVSGVGSPFTTHCYRRLSAGGKKPDTKLNARCRCVFCYTVS